MIRQMKSTFISGLLILLPLLLLFLLLQELIELLVVVATPIADLFPEGTFDTEYETEILAALLVFGAAMALGFLVRVPGCRSAGRFVSDKTVGKLPFYRMIRTITGAFLDFEDSTAFKPALRMTDTGEADPVYVIEDDGGPQIVVMVPWSPTAFSGRVKLVPRERIRVLALSLDEFSLILSNYGLGLSEILPSEQV